MTDSRNCTPIELGSGQRDSEAIASWLIARLARLGHIDPTDINQNRPFQDYQLDSSVAVTIVSELSEWLSAPLPLTIFWEYPTVASMANQLPALITESRAHNVRKPNDAQ